jgi:hypoxanthine phosphoribosyltransferase
MLDNNQFINYNDKDFKNGINRIHTSIRKSGWQPDIIVGIVRGGTIPAVYLSHLLAAPVQMVHYSTIDESSHKDFNSWVPTELDEGKKILVVEDIVDSGRTLKEILNSWRDTVKDPVVLNNIKIAALVANRSQDIHVHYFDFLIDRDKEERWFIFPWE